jgi:hypothetical protein
MCACCVTAPRTCADTAPAAAGGTASFLRLPAHAQRLLGRRAQAGRAKGRIREPAQPPGEREAGPSPRSRPGRRRQPAPPARSPSPAAQRPWPAAPAGHTPANPAAPGGLRWHAPATPPSGYPGDAAADAVVSEQHAQATGQWRKLPPMAYPRVGFAVVWTDRRLLVWGVLTDPYSAQVVPPHGGGLQPRDQPVEPRCRSRPTSGVFCRPGTAELNDEPMTDDQGPATEISCRACGLLLHQ